MPLDRAHVTSASRIMLPSYAIFFAVIGLGYIFGQAGRVIAAPMLRYADTIMPIQVWGGVFLACGLLMALALRLHHRLLYRWALTICGFSMVIWTGVAIAGAIWSDVTLTAWVWPWLVLQACRASNRSLLRGEQDQAGG